MDLDYTFDKPKEYFNCRVCKNKVERQTALQRECEIHEYWEFRRPRTVAELMEDKSCRLCGEKFKAYLGYSICVNCYLCTTRYVYNTSKCD